MHKTLHLPSLSYTGNERKRMTLHLFLQVMGKVRLGFTPRKNHWWYITEYISTQGITTGPIPYNNGLNTFEITLNVHHHLLEVHTSKGQQGSFSLLDGLPVADFYRKLLDLLTGLEIPVSIVDKPYDLSIDLSFGDIRDYHHYDPKYSRDFWRISLWVAGVFKEFSGRFYGKTCPVHLYWHSMDLAVTRFSGKRAPAMPKEARLSDKDAYSHECISFGFWGGDANLPEPAFYSYTYPSPDGLDTEPLSPEAARWVANNGSPMALLTYANLLQSNDPRSTLLDFMESAYVAGAKRAQWDVENLRVPSLNTL